MIAQPAGEELTMAAPLIFPRLLALVVVSSLLSLALPVEAAREAVLKQVQLPHSYYWRELYLPQLTTGPSAADFTPDGKALVYSMGGSLWHLSLIHI